MTPQQVGERRKASLASKGVNAASVRLRATFVSSLVIATCVAAAPPQGATIVNSGSTNSFGYTIAVRSDGTGTLTMQSRGESVAGAAKSFTLTAATTARFFSDLAAARKGNVAPSSCIKSASFGTSTHISWQGWTSPDLSCPPNDSLGEALVRDVDAIRRAAGISELPLRNAGPQIGPAGSEPPR
jgi:hypothetical protein